jgi:hypothetical protein
VLHINPKFLSIFLKHRWNIVECLHATKRLLCEDVKCLPHPFLIQLLMWCLRNDCPRCSKTLSSGGLVFFSLALVSTSSLTLSQIWGNLYTIINKNQCKLCKALEICLGQAQNRQGMSPTEHEMLPSGFGMELKFPPTHCLLKMVHSVLGLQM